LIKSETKSKKTSPNGETTAAPCSSHCSTTIDCDIKSTLAELHVAEQAIREEPYDRLPALAGMLAIASMRIEQLKEIYEQDLMMGEIADMMIEGLLDGETGELIDGDAPGHPRTMRNKKHWPKCPECGGWPGRTAPVQQSRRR